MKLLLDTHVLVWCQEKPERLGAASREAILQKDNVRFAHTISTLELARLQESEKIRLARPLLAWVNDAIDAIAGETLSLTHEHAAEAYRLPPPFHRDPCDRILVAAARVEGLTLVTADEAILRYPHVASLHA